MHRRSVSNASSNADTTETKCLFRTGMIQFRVLSRTLDPNALGVDKDSSFLRYFYLARGLDPATEELSTGQIVLKSVKTIVSWIETVFVTAPTTVMSDWSDTIAEGLAYDSKLDVTDMATAPFLSLHRIATSSTDDVSLKRGLEKKQIIDLFLRELQALNPRYLDDIIADVTEISRYRVMVDMLSHGNEELASHFKTMTVHQLILCEAAITLQGLFRGFSCRRKMLLKLVEDREATTNAFIVRLVRGLQVENVIVQLPRPKPIEASIKISGKDIPLRDNDTKGLISFTSTSSTSSFASSSESSTYLGNKVLRLCLRNNDFSTSYFMFVDDEETFTTEAEHMRKHTADKHQDRLEVESDTFSSPRVEELAGVDSVLKRTYVADIALVTCIDHPPPSTPAEKKKKKKEAKEEAEKEEITSNASGSENACSEEDDVAAATASAVSLEEPQSVQEQNKSVNAATTATANVAADGAAGKGALVTLVASQGSIQFVIPRSSRRSNSSSSVGGISTCTEDTNHLLQDKEAAEEEEEEEEGGVEEDLRFEEIFGLLVDGSLSDFDLSGRGRWRGEHLHLHGSMTHPVLKKRGEPSPGVMKDAIDFVASLRRGFGVEVLVNDQVSFFSLWLESKSRELVFGKKPTSTYQLGHRSTEADLIARLPFDDIIEVRQGVVSNAVDILYNRQSHLMLTIISRNEKPVTLMTLSLHLRNSLLRNIQHFLHIYRHAPC